MEFVETPLMRQWQAAKERYPDSLIMVRSGEFFNFFGDDAVLSARLLGIVLTSRNNGSAADVPMSGVPARARDEHIQKIIRAGHRVAILDQVQDSGGAKGVVRREIVEVMTPGSVLADGLLQTNRINFLVAVVEDDAGGYSVAAVDVSTGELTGTSVAADALDLEIARLEPSEILLPAERLNFEIASAKGVTITTRPAWLFDATFASDEMTRQFGVRSLDGFGLGSGDTALTGALGGLLAYVAQVQPDVMGSIRPPKIESHGDAMVLDDMTRRNLELTESLRPDLAGRGPDTTLLGVLDYTQTPMGARLLRRWVLRPLLSLSRISERHAAVAELVADRELRSAIRVELRNVRDLERLATKAAAGRITPREMRALVDSLQRLPASTRLLASAEAPLLTQLRGLDTLSDLAELLGRALVDEPPATLGEANVIREGVDTELDGLRHTREGAVDFIASLQMSERERTGIASLRVGYNQVFGYYLEVTRAHLAKVPDDYIRKQTLANAERYVTPELKEWEEKIVHADERIAALEGRLYAELRTRVATEAHRLLATAEAVATLDVLAAFAEGAAAREYTRPEMHGGYRLEIRQGRHPVVETMMPREGFIPNDVVLDESGRIVILTGPNMGGKSTILRQVGLIQLLAQIGSFVPAREAHLPVCDRIFTRVGASDNLAMGQSTYLVEVTETALILHRATDRSLVLLDEIGRGTATYDGVSIAWAITEHLHDEIGAKTIFATHYHELTQLAKELPALRNMSVLATETGDQIVFLYRLVDGGADRSYGVEVARLAGVPEPVITRAREILRKLEASHALTADGSQRPPARAATKSQLSLFADGHPVLQQIASLQIETMTPLDALNCLAALQADVSGRS